MKLLTSLQLFPLLQLFSVVSTRDVVNIPSCASTCPITFDISANCQSDDIKCFCTNLKSSVGLLQLVHVCSLPRQRYTELSQLSWLDLRAGRRVSRSAAAGGIVNTGAGYYSGSNSNIDNDIDLDGSEAHNSWESRNNE